MSNVMNADDACRAAAELLSQADGLLITAGAGMGIDSGMPDFRGENGFWKAYPALQGLGMRFHEIANPKAFHTMPAVAWGFYGHRLALYRHTVPHAGFAILHKIASAMPNRSFVFTSNVDGHFQKAAFDADHIVECHGTIHRMQCLANCGAPTWSADDFMPDVDVARCTLLSPLPLCPDCGGIARPNIMMFNDYEWDGQQVDSRRNRLETWRARLRQPVVIELGAGSAIATVRDFGEWLDCPLIRINPFEPAVALRRDIGISLGARAALGSIDRAFTDFAKKT